MSADQRPILLGESPSKTGDRYHMFPLSGAVAQTLCQLAGIPPQPDGSRYGRWTWALYEHFECRNVFDRYRDATPWQPSEAMIRVTEMVDDLAGRTLVCLGRRPQQAVCDWLGMASIPDWHVWCSAAGVQPIEFKFRWITIPHPSALNRQLQAADEQARCQRTLQGALAAGQVPA